MRSRLRFFVIMCLALAISTVFAGTRYDTLLAQAKKAIIYAPHPEYPSGARPQHMTGSGLFEMRIRVSTGRVIGVKIITSTGHSILDAAAVQALGSWKFKPGALPPLSVEQPKRVDSHATEDSLIRVPITFSRGKT